jgi:membrane protein DedA with SNARE-associated domain
MDSSIVIKSLEIFFEKYGYITVFFGSFIEITPLGWTVPGGLILAVAGFFSNTNSDISLIGIIVVGSLGAWVTFLLAYFLGLKSGDWLVGKLHQEKHMEIAKKLLEDHGGVILTTSMMSNLIRFWVAYVAGMQKYALPWFLLYSFAASLGWVSVMSFFGYLAGFERGNLENLSKSTGLIGWGLVIISTIIIYRIIQNDFKKYKRIDENKKNNK